LIGGAGLMSAAFFVGGVFVGMIGNQRNSPVPTVDAEPTSFELVRTSGSVATNFDRQSPTGMETITTASASSDWSLVRTETGRDEVATLADDELLAIFRGRPAILLDSAIEGKKHLFVARVLAGVSAESW
jgi:hypothetical protein